MILHNNSRPVSIMGLLKALGYKFTEHHNSTAYRFALSLSKIGLNHLDIITQLNKHYPLNAQ